MNRSPHSSPTPRAAVLELKYNRRPRYALRKGRKPPSPWRDCAYTQFDHKASQHNRVTNSVQRDRRASILILPASPVNTPRQIPGTPAERTLNRPPGHESRGTSLQTTGPGSDPTNPDSPRVDCSETFIICTFLHTLFQCAARRTTKGPSQYG